MAYEQIPVLIEKDVASAGTAEPLVANSTPTRSFVVQAKRGNTNPVAIGDSNVDESADLGLSLAAGEKHEFKGSGERQGTHALLDLADFYVDAETNGEGVIVIYQKSASNNHFTS